MIISTRLILWLVGAGLIVAVTSSFLIAKQLSATVSAESRTRDQQIVFGAIEAGPLAFARLQSAVIAQEQLYQLMENSQITDRGFLGAKIEGGPDFSFQFASWEKANSNHACEKTFQKIFRFDNAISPFRVTITTNTCHRLSEQNAIFNYSTAATLLVTFITLTLVGLSLYPVADSIRKAEQALGNGFKNIGQISYQPIRRLLREAIRKSELEREQALTTMAQQFSHDVRSPLSALNLAVQTLLNIPAETLSVIHAAIARINSISDQLIIHRQNIYETDKADFNLIPMVEELIREKRFEWAHRSNLNLDFQFELNIVIDCPFDAPTITRILSNLINNACEAIPNAGVVTVFVRSLKSEIEISVSDNGPGIRPEILEKLNRGELLVSRGTGSGIGLSHARRTIESWGGSLTIQSRISKGTIVRLSLPKIRPI